MGNSFDYKQIYIYIFSAGESALFPTKEYFFLLNLFLSCIDMFTYNETTYKVKADRKSVV